MGRASDTRSPKSEVRSPKCPGSDGDRRIRLSDFGLPGRDGVIAAAAPGMASANPPHGQPAPSQRAVRSDGVQRVFRATRGEPATAQRPEQQRFCRGNHPAIQAHAQHQNMLDRVHSARPAMGFNNLALRSVVKKSFSTAANPLPAMDWRATSTSSTGAARSYWCKRKASRRSRRARLRTTALPMRPAVITPRREKASAGSERQFAIRQPVTSRCPSRRTRAKSRPCLRRTARQNCRGCGVATAMDKSSPGSLGVSSTSASDRGQPLAANAAAIAQNAASALARIPAQKSMLPLAANLRRLILSLHKSVQFVSRESETRRCRARQHSVDVPRKDTSRTKGVKVGEPSSETTPPRRERRAPGPKAPPASRPARRCLPARKPPPAWAGGSHGRTFSPTATPAPPQ